MTDELGELARRLRERTADDHAETAALQEAVDAYLGSQTPSTADHDSLVDRLRDAARRYEASHPDLSALVAGVVDSLTASGI